MNNFTDIPLVDNSLYEEYLSLWKEIQEGLTDVVIERRWTGESKMFSVVHNGVTIFAVRTLK